MRKNIKLFKSIIFLSILLITSSKAELTNKVIMSVGNEIITNYDMARELKYLNVITVGQLKNLEAQEAKDMVTNSLIKDKIKINVLSNYDNIIIKDELIEDQIKRTFRRFGFNNIEDFKRYLEIENYNFEEFKKKVLLELQWNQLVYQFYKNQIVINKEKIDKKINVIISEQEKKKEYLIYEIFIEDAKIKKSNGKDEKALIEDNIVVEEEDKVVVDEKVGIIIKAESASYDNKVNIVKIIDTKNPEKKVIDSKTNNQITIDDIMKSIKQKGFKDTAIQFSSSSNSQQGGRLGWISESEFSEILLKHIKNSKVGNVTKPIPVPGGILIIKVENKRTEKSEIDIERKMNELIQIEKNSQLTQFSSNYFNQVKNNIKIKYFDE